ncbi:MAG: hypothetical protein IPH84_13545 [Bacteroidales bacterium]|nr:hypothetical protein [Bacteroidales bacterium]
MPGKFGFHQEIGGNIFGELQQVFNFEDIGIKLPVVAKVILATIENDGGKVDFTGRLVSMLSRFSHKVINASCTALLLFQSPSHTSVQRSKGLEFSTETGIQKRPCRER